MRHVIKNKRAREMAIASVTNQNYTDVTSVSSDSSVSTNSQHWFYDEELDNYESVGKENPLHKLAMDRLSAVHLRETQVSMSTFSTPGAAGGQDAMNLSLEPLHLPSFSHDVHRYIDE